LANVIGQHLFFTSTMTKPTEFSGPEIMYLLPVR